MAKATPVRKCSRKTKTKVYIGPSAPALGLLRGRIFKGVLPVELEDLLRANSWMEGLFVAPSNVGKSVKEATLVGTVKFNLVERLKEKIKEVRR